MANENHFLNAELMGVLVNMFLTGGLLLSANGIFCAHHEGLTWNDQLQAFTTCVSFNV